MLTKLRLISSDLRGSYSCSLPKVLKRVLLWKLRTNLLFWLKDLLAWLPRRVHLVFVWKSVIKWNINLSCAALKCTFNLKGTEYLRSFSIQHAAAWIIYCPDFLKKRARCCWNHLAQLRKWLWSIKWCRSFGWNEVAAVDALIQTNKMYAWNELKVWTFLFLFFLFFSALPRSQNNEDLEPSQHWWVDLAVQSIFILGRHSWLYNPYR